MNRIRKFLAGLDPWEVIFQVLLNVLLMLFFSVDKAQTGLRWYQVAFFINYAIAALLINYFLLPLFYYRKKYLQFIIAIALILTLVIVVEELVLEKIYFPTTRGASFPGISYSLVEVLPILMLLTGFKFAWDAHKKHRELDALQQSIKEGELQFLKSQINPHFLFNNLNNLYAYAIEQSPKTPSIILELSSVLRYMLYDCRTDRVPLSKEVNHLQNFTRLNELQIENRGRIHFEHKNISDQYQIAPLILIVFVENAFKHSSSSQTNEIEIDINIDLFDRGILNFECQNTFRQTSNVERLSQGIGLENVRKRLALLYPNRYQLEIEDSEPIYRVKLSLELDQR